MISKNFRSAESLSGGKLDPLADGIPSGADSVSYCCLPAMCDVASLGVYAMAKPLTESFNQNTKIGRVVPTSGEMLKGPNGPIRGPGAHWSPLGPIGALGPIRVPLGPGAYSGPFGPWGSFGALWALWVLLASLAISPTYLPE